MSANQDGELFCDGCNMRIGYLIKSIVLQNVRRHYPVHDENFVPPPFYHDFHFCSNDCLRKWANLLDKVRM